MFPLWYLAFLFSLTCHEAAHALVAQWGGDLTAYQEGQVTLNPMPHMRREPWGTVLWPILTYLINGSIVGWGSAPYDPYWEQRYPRRAAWMALAGPVANLILMVLAGVAMRVAIGLGGLQRVAIPHFEYLAGSTDPVWDGVARFLSILFSLNVLLAVFNLMPVPPLDGNSAITLLLPESLAERFREFTRQPMLGIFGILIAWWLCQPFFRAAWTLALAGVLGYRIG